MIILGDRLIPYEKIEKIEKIEDIKTTSSNSTILFRYDEEILKYCYDNSLAYAVEVREIKEAIYSNNLNAKYIIPSTNSTLEKIQQIADNYMFDAKILAPISNSDEIEEFALKQIDGVIYRDLF